MLGAMSQCGLFTAILYIKPKPISNAMLVAVLGTVRDAVLRYGHNLSNFSDLATQE